MPEMQPHDLMVIVHRLWPEPSDEELSDRGLERIYAYPQDLDRPWVQVNFVGSADGAVSMAGVSRGLSSPGDKRVFALHRDLADVVLVGAATALIEGYRGVKDNEVRAERRRRHGLGALPAIAVVSARCSILPDSPLVTDTLVPTIVLTCAAAPPQRRDELAAAGADVVVAGDDTVDLPRALAALGDRGLRRVDCEGGPRLFAGLIADDLVDRLCLTVSPLLVAGDADRIAHGPGVPDPRRLRLERVLRDDDFLMLSYRRSPA